MERKHLYKSASETVDGLRARRREEQSGLRKEKREQILSFKRLRFEVKEEGTELDDLTVEEVLVVGKSLQKHGSNSLNDLKRLRNAFTQGSKLVDAFIIQDGTLQALVGYLTGNDAELQIEAAWCFTNLAGATQQHGLRILMASGAYLITYLKGQNVQLVDLCGWTLGNLAVDSEECRRILRDQGAVDPLLNLLKSTSPNVVQSAAFALCNFARTMDESIIEDLKNGGLGSYLHHLLKAPSTPSDVMTELCWILTYFSVTPENVNYLSSCGIDIALVVELLARYLESQDSVQIVTPILRTIGNICSGTDEHGTSAIRSGILIKIMPALLSSSSHHIKKESLWVLSNLTVGSHETLVAVLSAGLLPVVVDMLDGTFDIRKESAIVLCNVAHNGPEYMKRILEYGGLGKFLQLLKSLDNELTFLAVQFFEMMLRSLPESQDSFEKAEGVAYLEALLYNRNKEICQCVNDLMLMYFEQEDNV